MKSYVRAGLMAVMAVAAGACASPQRGGPGGGPPQGMAGSGGLEGKYAKPVALLLVGYDADRDLRVTRAEASAGAEADWARLGGSGPGDASAFAIADWGVAALGAAEALPNRLSFDTDGSSGVSKAEFIDGIAREFARADANHDGVLTRAELLADAPRMQMREQGPGGGGGMPPGGGGQRRRGGGPGGGGPGG